MVNGSIAKKPRTQPRSQHHRPPPSDVRIDIREPAHSTRLANSGSSGSRRRNARASPPDGSFPVRTEFVFTDGRSHKDVKLCGDWCKWEAVPMEVEQEGIWSVITIVPCGYREFVYVVDGEYTLSQRHPTNAEGTCNWRTVHGPPSPPETDADRRLPEARHRLLRFADAAADHLRSFILYCVDRGCMMQDNGVANGRRCPHTTAAGLPEVESDTYAQPSPTRMFKKTLRIGGTVRLLAFVLFLSGCYFLTATKRK